MIVYSTCRDCGGLLWVTNPDDKVHPNCTPKPTKVEQLAHDWLAAIERSDEFTADAHEYDIEQIDTRPPRLLDAALRYASWGWPVFPLKPLSVAKRAHNPTKAAKSPATKHGFKDATTDTGRIRQWWTKHPDSNIGLATGHAFDVIDIDVPDGLPTHQELLAEDRAVHGHVVTASGGTHFYITPTGRGCSTRWKAGADFRGEGGYVVAPPSTLWGRGRQWSWAHPPSPVLTGMGDTYGR